MRKFCKRLSHLHETLPFIRVNVEALVMTVLFLQMTQCRKWPVAQWPNAPNFCLGPLEISKFWTLVAQIYLSGNSK